MLFRTWVAPVAVSGITSPQARAHSVRSIQDGFLKADPGQIRRPGKTQAPSLFSPAPSALKARVALVDGGWRPAGAATGKNTLDGCRRGRFSMLMAEWLGRYDLYAIRDAD